MNIYTLLYWIAEMFLAGAAMYWGLMTASYITQFIKLRNFKIKYRQSLKSGKTKAEIHDMMYTEPNSDDQVLAMLFRDTQKRSKL